MGLGLVESFLLHPKKLGLYSVVVDGALVSDEILGLCCWNIT